MPDNPTDNAQVQDGAGKEAWRLVDLLIENPGNHVDEILVGDHGFYESSAHHIAQALREARREGMMEAAKIAREYPAEEHGCLYTTPAYAARQAANEIAQAVIAKANTIERAAKEG